MNQNDDTNRSIPLENSFLFIGMNNSHDHQDFE